MSVEVDVHVQTLYFLYRLERKEARDDEMHGHLVASLENALLASQRLQAAIDNLVRNTKWASIFIQIVDVGSLSSI